MVFKNGKVFTEGKFQEADVKVTDGKIAEVGKNFAIEAGEEVIDL